MTDTLFPDAPVLVLGATGKTGRRVAARLAQARVPHRLGSRAGTPPFDWSDRRTWGPALDGMHAVYVTYQPDLLVPEAEERIGAFGRAAVAAGATRLVLLSGRGEEGAVRCERALAEAGGRTTVVRGSWFAQNFSESFLFDAVLGGTVALPAGPVGEPFLDVDDLADVVVETLRDPAHAGATYDLTGPRLLTFEEAVAEVAAAAGRPIRYVELPVPAFEAALREAGAPPDLHAVLVELFTRVLDGRNAHTTDHVARVLGRPPRDFADYARATAATGLWRAPAA